MWDSNMLCMWNKQCRLQYTHAKVVLFTRACQACKNIKVQITIMCEQTHTCMFRSEIRKRNVNVRFCFMPKWLHIMRVWGHTTCTQFKGCGSRPHVLHWRQCYLTPDAKGQIQWDESGNSKLPIFLLRMNSAGNNYLKRYPGNTRITIENSQQGGGVEIAGREKRNSHCVHPNEQLHTGTCLREKNKVTHDQGCTFDLKSGGDTKW